MASVKLIDVFKSFDNNKYAINGINLSINDGEFLVIVGPSGCGKTTILNLIAGLETVSSGKILINEKNVNNVEPKNRNITMVFQNNALYPHLSVYENLAFSLKIKRIKKDIIEKKVETIANMLEISDLLKRKPHQLSGGQKQRVAIGRAVIREPLVFLMDEPLSNLDINLKSSIHMELKRLHKELQATFLYVTHDQIEAMTLATQLVVMNKGKIQQIGTPYEIFMNPNNMFVAKFMSAYPLNIFYYQISGENQNHKINFIGGVLQFKLKKTYKSIRKIYIGIKPEGFTISVNNLGLKFQILSMEILGINSFLECLQIINTQDNYINLLLPTQSIKNTKEIIVTPTINMIMIFDAETKERIQVEETMIFNFR